MPAERKFNFLPVKNEDLQKRVFKEKEEPYVRLTSAGQILFPRTTLEHLGHKEGDVLVIKFYIDTDKRAIGFKINDPSLTQEGLKDCKTARVQKQNGGGKYFVTFAQVSIKNVLKRFSEFDLPCKCTLESYNDSDGYLSIGKLYYIKLPRKSRTKEEGTDQI